MNYVPVQAQAALKGLFGSSACLVLRAKGLRALSLKQPKAFALDFGFMPLSAQGLSVRGSAQIDEPVIRFSYLLPGGDTTR